MKRMRAPIITVIAISVGLIILLGYFVPLPLLQDLRLVFLGWGVILVGVATLLGVVNLILVHVRKIQDAKAGGFLSFLLVAAFAVSLGLGLWLTPADPNYQQVVNAIQVPLETSLMAMLAVVLAYTGLRLLRRGRDLLSIVFLFSTLIFLILGSGLLPYLENVPLLPGLIAFIRRLPLAGARGILLGVALGSITTGLRILIGTDRPYSG